MSLKVSTAITIMVSLMAVIVTVISISVTRVDRIKDHISTLEQRIVVLETLHKEQPKFKLR